MQPTVHDTGDDGCWGAKPVVDFAFLAEQTFDDVALEREILDLFLAQARRVLSRIATIPEAEQFEAAHLLTGSARAIGAWPAAEAAQAFGQSDPASRQALCVRLADAFREAERVIVAHIVQRER